MSEVLDIRQLLQAATLRGLPLEAIGGATDMPVSLLKKLLEGDHAPQLPLPQADQLMAFLTQLVCASPQEPVYYREMVRILADCFGVSLQAVAAYAGVSAERLEAVLHSPAVLEESVLLYVKIMHLFAAFKG